MLYFWKACILWRASCTFLLKMAMAPRRPTLLTGGSKDFQSVQISWHGHIGITTQFPRRISSRFRGNGVKHWSAQRWPGNCMHVSRAVSKNAGQDDAHFLYKTLLHSYIKLQIHTAHHIVCSKHLMVKVWWINPGKMCWLLKRQHNYTSGYEQPACHLASLIRAVICSCFLLWFPILKCWDLIGLAALLAQFHSKTEFNHKKTYMPT